MRQGVILFSALRGGINLAEIKNIEFLVDSSIDVAVLISFRKLPNCLEAAILRRRLMKILTLHVGC